MPWFIMVHHVPMCGAGRVIWSWSVTSSFPSAFWPCEAALPSGRDMRAAGYPSIVELDKRSRILDRSGDYAKIPAIGSRWFHAANRRAAIGATVVIASSIRWGSLASPIHL
jgi:hypothetical protein